MPSGFAPTGRFGDYDALGNTPVGFNVGWLGDQITRTLAGRINLMPSFNFMGGGGSGTSLSGFGAPDATPGGGWSDIASAGINLLGSWAQSRAMERATKRRNRSLRRMSQAANPYMNVNPNLGGASTPFVAAGTGGVQPWGIIPTLPGGFGAPDAPDGTPGWTLDRGTGDLGDLWDWITGGDDVAEGVPTSAVTVRRASPPRIVGAINNTTGKSAFYRYVGAPILFRGDLTTLKTAKKAVSKFGGLARNCGKTFRRRRR